MLARALAGTTNGFYIDVGAHDPEIDSVTQHFYDQGWRGVNIEPAVRQCERFVLRRPLDVNLAVALGRREGRLRFHDFSPYGLSTCDVESARRMHARGFASRDYDVPVTTLAAVCAEHAPDTIDFLKIDVEGTEAEVIAGADWAAHRPRIVVVEATRPLDGAPSYAEWEPSLIAGGYLFGVVRWREPVLSAARGRTACAAFQCAPQRFRRLPDRGGRPVAGRDRPAAPQHGDANDSRSARMGARPGRCQAQGAMTAECASFTSSARRRTSTTMVPAFRAWCAT